jgi:hypothetical protein
MLEKRNLEFSNLDRLTQLERMGVTRPSHAKMIFTLECMGYKEEARTMFMATTNLYINQKYVRNLFQKYFLMILEFDNTFCV